MRMSWSGWVGWWSGQAFESFGEKFVKKLVSLNIPMLPLHFVILALSRSCCGAGDSLVGIDTVISQVCCGQLSRCTNPDAKWLNHIHLLKKIDIKSSFLFFPFDSLHAEMHNLLPFTFYSNLPWNQLQPAGKVRRVRRYNPNIALVRLSSMESGGWNPKELKDSDEGRSDREFQIRIICDDCGDPSGFGPEVRSRPPSSPTLPSISLYL